jgi:peptide/nickel transport system substrate-binding protein
MSFFKNIFRALSRMERRALWIGVACLVVGAAGFITIFIWNRTAIVPAYSGVYTEGAVGQPSYVNPVLAAGDADQGLVRLIFANLTTLSDSIETSADGRTVQVRLKQDLAWSDGQPLTSDDVVFTLKAIQDPDSRSPLAGLFQDVTAERKSALEIDFRLENVALAPVISDLRPAPQHLYNDIPAANWRLSDYNLRPVSSGPYVFVSRDTDADGFITAYRLTPNRTYAGERPYIQNVNFLFYHAPGDLLAAFNGGQVQGLAGADPLLLEGIQRPYSLVRFNTPTVYAVFWNQTANPALAPIEARWALNLAIDRGKVLAGLMDLAEPAEGPFPPALLPPPAPTSTAPTSTGAGVEEADGTGEAASGTATSSAGTATSTATNDPAAILESRGWRRGDDGVWAKSIAKTDVRLEFTLTVPDILFLRNAAENIAEQWRAFGAAVELRVLPADNELLAAITNRDYDGLLFGNTVRGLGDLHPFWHSSRRFAPGLNLAIYQNSRVDALLEDLRRETDPQERLKDMRLVSGLIADDEPAAFLFSLNNFYVVSKSVQGVSGVFLQNPADRLEQLPQWYVATTRRLK